MSAIPPTLEARRLSIPARSSRATPTLVSGPMRARSTPLARGERHRADEGCAIRIDDPTSAAGTRGSCGGPDSYLLEDLGSRNGTFIRGNRVTSQPLARDRLAIGPG